MGERKVLNKYFPPDFDPNKLPKGKRSIDNYMKVRMMMAMSVQCQTCGVFIYKGTKFNMRKEDVIGEDYLGIHIYRFYFRCPHCSSEITFKTDPMNSDYIVEHGAQRTTEPLKKYEAEIIRHKINREQEEAVDAMKALENRTHDSKQEIDILADIEKMRLTRGRQDKLGLELALSAIRNSRMKDESAYDQKEFKKMLDEQARLIRQCWKENELKHDLKMHITKRNRDINEPYKQESQISDSRIKTLKPVIIVKKA